MKQKSHYLTQELIDTPHRITVNVIGAGGTGSHMLTNLAMINEALKRLDRQQLHVSVFDPDNVSETNIGRQAFSPADVGGNKAKILVNRINRFYGLAWEAYAEHYPDNDILQSYSANHYTANVTFLCVDNVSTRQKSIQFLKDIAYDSLFTNYAKPYYVIDIGNGRDFGQVILSTIARTDQPHSIRKVNRIVTIAGINYDDETFDFDDDAPSCSTMEALTKQDLFVNKILADIAGNMFWQLMFRYSIDYSAVFVNLETMQMQKAKF